MPRALVDSEDANQVCPACGTINPLVATCCISCGVKLSSASPRASVTLADISVDEEALQHVDVANRVALGRYEFDTQAELAAGLLRSSGIACELAPPVIPGLAADLTLWVNAQDAEAARRILSEVERSSCSGGEDIE